MEMSLDRTLPVPGDPLQKILFIQMSTDLGKWQVSVKLMEYLFVSNRGKHEVYDRQLTGTQVDFQ
jgi:hypothetical protein